MKRAPGRTLIAVLLLAALTACGTEPETAEQPTASPTPEAVEETEEPVAEESAKPEPRTQAEDCDWDGAAVSTASIPELPGEQAGTLQDVIIGSWQHTHFDSGAGFEAIEGKDIRYVFPAADRLLYCQHVPGITDHASNAATFTWDGERIALPGGAPGYTVTAWNDSVMLWTNHTDDSTYLLQRR